MLILAELAQCNNKQTEGLENSDALNLLKSKPQDTFHVFYLTVESKNGKTSFEGTLSIPSLMHVVMVGIQHHFAYKDNSTNNSFGVGPCSASDSKIGTENMALSPFKFCT